MNRHETLKEYLTALYRAEAVVTDNPSAPLYFNGTRSLTDYRIHLLDVELPVITCLRSIRQAEAKDDALAVSVRVTLLELQTLFGEENGQSTHRYLTIAREGIPIERELLDASQLELLEEYLRFLGKIGADAVIVSRHVTGQRHGHRRTHRLAYSHVAGDRPRQQVPDQGIHPVFLSSMEPARGERLLHADQPHAGPPSPDSLYRKTAE